MLLCLFVTLSTALPDTSQENNGVNQRFFGGILGDLFGGSGQCQNCRYDRNQARYCCRSNLDNRCCNYINSGTVGGSDYNPGNNYNNNNKPGSCPNNYGRKRRSPEDAPWLINNGYNNGYGYNNNGLNWQGNSGNNNGYNRCYTDGDCPGRQKCCNGSYNNRRTCVYPSNYYG